MMPGNAIELLETGQDFFPALIDAIDQAQREVFVETYIFWDDATGQKVAQALCLAAQRGVAVRLVVDGYGSMAKLDWLQARVQPAGVTLHVFRPETAWWRLSRSRLRRLHRKLAVIDRRTAFVGGINVLDDFGDPNHGKLEHPRFDFAVRVRGPLVFPVLRAVERMWWQLAIVNAPLSRESRTLMVQKLMASRLGVSLDEMRGSAAGRAGRMSRAPQRLQAEQLVAQAQATARDQRAGRLTGAFIVRDNFRFRRTIEAQYLAAIAAAERDILIANAYFLPGKRFRRALIDAAHRGVKVRLLLQGRVEYRFQHHATRALYEELLACGIEIFEYRRSFLHAKVAVVDDWSTVGSSNIDPFSLLLAREANVIVTDGSFAQHLRARLQQAIAAGAEPVPLPDHVNRGWLTRLGDKFAFAMLRLAVTLTGRSSTY